jgi:hypothetical protein
MKANKLRFSRVLLASESRTRAIIESAEERQFYKSTTAGHPMDDF